MFEKRLRLVALCGTAFFVVILVRLFEMQVINGQEWRQKASDLARRHMVLEGRRGTLMDREGRVLAEDRLHFDLTVHLGRYREHPWVCGGCGRPATTKGEKPPRRCSSCAGVEFTPGEPADWSRLLGILSITAEEFSGLFGKAWARYRAAVDAETKDRGEEFGVSRRRDVEKVHLRRNWLLLASAPPEAVREVALHPERYRGIEVRPSYRRWRTDEKVLMPLVGKLSQAFENEYRMYREKGYSKREIWRMKVGRSGLERAFEEALGGREGRREVARDQRGRVTEIISETLPVDGRDVRISIDTRLQVLMAKTLAEAVARQGAKGGAFVAVDPGTGEILVLASHAADAAAGQNYALSATMPGSVFKVVTALAGLESRTLDPRKTFPCTTHRWRGFRCAGHDLAQGDGHGLLNVTDALCHSCNKFFAWAADPEEGMGIHVLNHWADLLGFGKLSGLGLHGEQPGILATPEWRAQQYDLHPVYWRTSALTAGEIRQVGFGKGPVSVTPLQVARMMAVVANGGFDVPLILEVGKGGRRDRIFSTGTVAPVRKGLEAVVAEGTGRRTGLSRFKAAGKTGTAEVKADTKDHMAWFAGYAPSDHPRVAFACYLRNTSAYGADAAGPVVAAFLEEYLKR